MMYSKIEVELLQAIIFGKPALLASFMVSIQGLAALCLPIRAIIMSSVTVNIARVIFANSVQVSTLARAILSSVRLVGGMATKAVKNSAAMLADKLNLSRAWFCFCGSILTLWRTMLSSTVFGTRGYKPELFTAILTSVLSNPRAG